METFSKPTLSVAAQIALLQQRGLLISDIAKASHYLQTIGYYRLSAYFLPYQQKQDLFCPEASFDDALELYLFDKQLRMLVIEALERIEICVRTTISNEMSSSHGAHWFMNAACFNGNSSAQKESQAHIVHTNFMTTVDECAGNNPRGKAHKGCAAFYKKYDNPTYPPSWIVAETLTMGVWSRIFTYLPVKNKKRIAKYFGLTVNDMAPWFHSMTFFRNCVAHHSRFWNFSFPPKAKNIEKYTHSGIPLNTPYANLAMIYATLKRISPTSRWSTRLYELIQQCPVNPYDPKHMAFPVIWHTLPFWQIS